MSGLFLLPVAIAVPLLLAGLGLLPGLKRHGLVLCVIAPLPGLAAALFAARGETVTLPDLLLGLRLEMSETGAVFLGGAALLWLAAAVHATGAMKDEPRKGAFALFWLLAIAGKFTLILAADAIGFYAGFALVSLISWPLIAFKRTERARRAGTVYLALAIIGEVALLCGLVMAVAAAGGSHDIDTIRQALGGSPRAWPVLALLLAAFGIKAALIPAHVWAPLAYPAAPVPAAAVLSGSIANAGIIGFACFMPLEAGAPVPGSVLAVLGYAGTFGAALIGLTQTNPRAVLAYSSISQLGLMSGTLGLALAAGLPAAPVLAALALYAAHHGLAKGALFLGTSVASRSGGAAHWRIRAVLGAAALSITGFALTGGGVAKLALKYELPVIFEYAVIASAVTTALVLLRFLAILPKSTDTSARAPLTLAVPVLLLTLCALGLPWVLTGLVPAGPAYAVKPANLINALWPVIAAIILFLAPRPMTGPRIPQGDILALAERFWQTTGQALARMPAPHRPRGLTGRIERFRRGTLTAIARAETWLSGSLASVMLLAALAFAGALILTG